MYTHLENKLCKELQSLEEKYRTGAEMSEGDLRRIDLLVHSLKSMATYKAMKEAEEYANNTSYNSAYMGNNYRGRDMGRYSREMNPDMSGHMSYPPFYPEERRW